VVVLFEGTGNVVSESANLFWDNTNGRLGIGTSSPIHPLTINGRALIGTATNIGSGTGLTALQVSAIGTSPIQILSDSTKVFGLTYEYNSAATSFYIYSDYYTGAIEPKLTFGTFTNKTNQLVLNKTGNVGINTTTDAGYKLDVNGDTRLGSGSTTGTVEVRGSNIVIFRVNDVLNNNNIGIYKNATSGYLFESSSANQLSYGYASNYWMSWRNSTKSIAIASTGSEPTPSATAIFDLQSTTKGFLPPRMTTTQKNAIASPATGLVLFDTTLNKLCVYTTAWETVTSL
jgi:hypothetical protein